MKKKVKASMKKKVKASVVVAIITIALATCLSSASVSASATGPVTSPAPPGPVPPSPPNDRVAAATLAPARTESVYVPVTPCRIVDTRAAGGALGNGTIRTYYVGGTFGFTSQGGKPGGCGIPVGATAIAATVTAVSPSRSGFMKAWPTGQAEPNATVLNYIPQFSLGTGTTLPVYRSSAFALRVKNLGGPTQLVIDVAGYYAPQIEGMISPAAAVYSGSSRILSAVHNGVGNYTVTVDSDVSYCTPTVTAYSGYVFASAYGFNGTKVQVSIWYLSAGTPTAYDGYFYLNVTC